MRYEPARAIVAWKGEYLQGKGRDMNGETDATAKWAQEGTVLLVALEPRCYREAIGRIVAARRQALSVKIVEPDDLVAEAAWLRRGLVLCSRKS